MYPNPSPSPSPSSRSNPSPYPYAIIISKCTKYVVDTKIGVHRFGISIEGTAPYTTPQISTNTLSITIYNKKTGKQPLPIQTVPIHPDGTWTLSTGIVPDATYIIQASVGINSNIPIQNAETTIKIYREKGYIGWIFVFLPLILLFAPLFMKENKGKLVFTFIDIVYFISFIVVVSMFHKNSFTRWRLIVSIFFSIVLFLVSFS